jgi:hypothetical protein
MFAAARNFRLRIESLHDEYGTSRVALAKLLCEAAERISGLLGCELHVGIRWWNADKITLGSFDSRIHLLLSHQ